MGILSAIRKVIILKVIIIPEKFQVCDIRGIRDFRASLESRRKVRLLIKGEYFETNFFKIGHLFAGRSTLNSSLLDTHFEVNYRRLMSERLGREEKDGEKGDGRGEGGTKKELERETQAGDTNLVGRS